MLGPPVETVPPVAVFTGPANAPDPVVATSGPAKKKKKVASKQNGESASGDKPKNTGTSAAKKPAKPKVSSAAQ